MDLENKFFAKDKVSSPVCNGHSDDASRSPELLQDFLKLGAKKELLRPCFSKQKKGSPMPKSKMTKSKTNVNTMKKQEQKKVPCSNHSHHTSKKSSRKKENPMRLQTACEEVSKCSDSWVCKNSACQAILSFDDTFCKRCTCCICHLFDDNKDPSLWLVCSSEAAQEDTCGLSCHIECALQREKVGVVDLGQLMQLDVSYCCASCGKVSGILGCWKKQLIVAREARRVDVLCYRIYLSSRLLEGTSRFKEIHEIVKDAKDKLEKEVGPLNGVSAKMARGIVSRLPVAGDVVKICSLAIEKADEWLAAAASDNSGCRVDSRPAACRFLFEEITSSSIAIILLKPSNVLSDDIKGYKLWYCKSIGETLTKEPVCVFPRAQRRILISNMQPCTEYTFRIVSYSEDDELGHSEAKCFTKSIELVHKSSKSAAPKKQKDKTLTEGFTSIRDGESETATPDGRSGFKVRDLGKILHFAYVQEQDSLQEGFSGDRENFSGVRGLVKSEALQYESQPVSLGIDLNVASVPDLNEDIVPVSESSRDEYNACNLQHAVDADDDAASLGRNKITLSRSHASDDSQTWTREAIDVAAVDSISEPNRKRAASASEEPHDSDSTLINGMPFQITGSSGSVDESFEYCVKIIRWLECEGYIDKEFRLKLLTWFSLRSTEQERRVVNTFIQTLIDDPSSLAGQLVDSFSDIISNKRPRNGFCGNLWH